MESRLRQESCCRGTLQNFTDGRSPDKGTEGAMFGVELAERGVDTCVQRCCLVEFPGNGPGDYTKDEGWFGRVFRWWPKGNLRVAAEGVDM